MPTMASPEIPSRRPCHSSDAAPRRWLRWTTILLLGIGLLTHWSAARAEDATPPPATPLPRNRDFDGLVDIGNGRHLYLTCRGMGGPTVLLEAGAGNNAQIWEQLALPSDSDEEAVFPAVAGFTRVCAYDRPGTMLDETHLSRSDPVPGPRTAEQVVADLHALIDAARLEGPLVLAGHSFGGLVVRLYANTYPDGVAGLVLIDSAHEAYYQGLETLLTPEQYAAVFHPPANDAGPAFESLDPLASAEQVIAAQAASPLQPMPIVVLTHGGPFPFPDDFPVTELEAVWMTGQQQLAALVPGAPLIVAPESGHYIQLDQPDLVISAIHQVVTAVRTPSTWATTAYPPATPRGTEVTALRKRSPAGTGGSMGWGDAMEAGLRGNEGPPASVGTALRPG